LGAKPSLRVPVTASATPAVTRPAPGTGTAAPGTRADPRRWATIVVCPSAAMNRSWTRLVRLMGIWAAQVPWVPARRSCAISPVPGLAGHTVR